MKDSSATSEQLYFGTIKITFFPFHEEINLLWKSRKIAGQASVRTGNKQPLVEGYMIHYMLDQPDRRLRHYWILTSGAINMYCEYYDSIGNHISLLLRKVFAFYHCDLKNWCENVK